jgi:hypothetical protein
MSRTLHNITMVSEEELAPDSGLFFGIEADGNARLYSKDWFVGYAIYEPYGKAPWKVQVWFSQDNQFIQLRKSSCKTRKGAYQALKTKGMKLLNPYKYVSVSNEP